METQKIAQVLGVVIAVVMALSLLAGALLYAGNGSSASTNNTEPLPQATDKQFDYTMGFNTTALSDLGSLRMAAYTSSIDKAQIDSAVMKISGVSNVTSQFDKPDASLNEWRYLADVTVKKGTSLGDVTNALINLNYFDKNQPAVFAKYITVSAPKSVMLYNTDLNIDRNYSFSSTTLPVLAGITTTQGDSLIVSGNISLKGTTVLALSLVEAQNLTKEGQMQIDVNAPISVDTNTPISDTNAPAADTNKPTAAPFIQADANSPADSNL